MLKAYFDESGEHDPQTNNLLRLHVGGVLASSEIWNLIDENWREALSAAHINHFHMKDFAHSRGEFQGWDEVRRRRMLGSLLDILAEHELSLIDVSFPAETSTFKNVYANCMAQVINGTCSVAALRHKSLELSVVFAETPGHKHHNTEEFWGTVRRYVPTLISCNAGTPQKLSQLQVADLVCYEFSHMERSERTIRYPLRRLLTDQRSFYVSRIP
jgi:hypothetical protein